MLKTIILVGAILGTSTAFADEVIVHHDDVAPPPTESSTTVEHHTSSDGCESKSVHKENGYGDSKTVTKSDC